MIPCPLFQFPLGQAVRWAAAPRDRSWIRQRRWTERDGLGPLVEYALEWRTGRSLCWAYEADVTCWEEPPPPPAARRDPVPPIDIDDLFVEAIADGQSLRFTNTTQQPTTIIGVEGAMALWGWLYDWLWEEPLAPEDLAALVERMRRERTP
jgi:hypothetical protein